MTHSIQSLWEEFLKRYYWEDIINLANEYPDRISLTVNFADVQRFDCELADALESEPDTTFGDANQALREIDLPADVVLGKAEIRIHGFSCIMKLRDIRSDHIGKLVAVTGTIVKETGVKGRIITSAHECQRCGYITVMHQTDPNKYIEPFECGNDDCGRKGPFTLNKKESIFVDTKKIRLQESYEDLGGGKHPQTMDLEFLGDLSSLCQAGDSITLTGIVRSIQRTAAQGKTPLFDYCLDVNSVEVHESDLADIEITLEDRGKIVELIKHLEIIDMLVASFANSIRGHESIKEAVLVSSVSSESISLPDGTVKRGTSNVLICGDPGTAKTQMLRAAKNLVPRAQYCTGDGSSKAGLTAAVVKDDFGDGRWSLEAGALVMADRAIALVDELDKIKKEEVPHLNTVLESNQIFINKAGINRMLWARCPVIAALNPKFGRFDSHEPLPGQVNIPPPTLSRFDLIFFLEDRPNPEKDRDIAELQAQLWQAGSLMDAGNMNWSDFKQAVPEIPPDLMRKYLIICKQIKVKISDACKMKLQEFFLSLRGRYDKNEGTRVIPVTLRQHDALFRLAKAEARLRHSDVAELQDAERAIRLVSESLRQAGTDPGTGHLDTDIIGTGASASQRQKMKNIREIILQLQGEDGGVAARGEIILRATEARLDGFVEAAISMLMEKGEIIEMRKDHFRVV